MLQLCVNFTEQLLSAMYCAKCFSFIASSNRCCLLYIIPLNTEETKVQRHHVTLEVNPARDQESGPFPGNLTAKPLFLTIRQTLSMLQENPDWIFF